MNDFRNLMESIDDIMEESDDVINNDNESLEIIKELTKELPKFIKTTIDGLAEYTQKIKNGESLDQSDIDNLSDMLSIMKEINNSDEELEENCGTENMGPSFDNDGTQNYKNPNGQSYPEIVGFVGI